MNSAELLQQQLNASNKRKKPKGVKQDLQAGATYHSDLRRIVREVRKDIDTYILGAVKSTSFEYVADGISTHVTLDSYVDVIAGALNLVRSRWSNPQFTAIATRIARKFVTTADSTNEQRTKRDLGIDVFVGNQELRDYVEASIFDNVRLIESIPQQYLTQVDSIVMTNVRAGNRPSAIVKSLQKQFNITENRAKLIARDQTAKLNGDLNKMRQTAAGFPYFQWIDSGDERVRDRHEHINDKVTAYGHGIYRWDNPPLSDRGTPIIPGQDFQCRCIARPVSQEEVDANVKAGRVRKGVLR